MNFNGDWRPETEGPRTNKLRVSTPYLLFGRLNIHTEYSFTRLWQKVCLIASLFSRMGRAFGGDELAKCTVRIGQSDCPLWESPIDGPAQGIG